MDWVPTVLQSTEATKGLQGAGLFHCACRWETATPRGEAHKRVWSFTRHFAEKNINAINISAVYSLCLCDASGHVIQTAAAVDHLVAATKARRGRLSAAAAASSGKLV